MGSFLGRQFWYAMATVWIKFLYLTLMLCTAALVWTVAACYLRVRRHMAASDEVLRQALEEIDQERTATEAYRS